MKIHCDNCNSETDTTRDSSVPEGVHAIHCNWCPKCEDQATGYWEEYFVDKDGNTLTFEW